MKSLCAETKGQIWRLGVKNSVFRLGNDISDLRFMETFTVVDVVCLVLLKMHKCEWIICFPPQTLKMRVWIVFILCLAGHATAAPVSDPVCVCVCVHVCLFVLPASIFMSDFLSLCVSWFLLSSLLLLHVWECEFPCLSSSMCVHECLCVHVSVPNLPIHAYFLWVSTCVFVWVCCNCTSVKIECLLYLQNIPLSIHKSTLMCT